MFGYFGNPATAKKCSCFSQKCQDWLFSVLLVAVLNIFEISKMKTFMMWHDIKKTASCVKKTSNDMPINDHIT